METLESIKQKLKEEYNNAILAYNDQDPKVFFRNIRLAIEYIGKLIIFDMLSETEANNILSGIESIDFDTTTNCYSKVALSPNCQPQGSSFVHLAKKAIFYKKPDIIQLKNDDDKKRLKKKIDSNISSLIEYYSCASELAMHTNSSLDLYDQAKSCAFFFPKMIDDFSKVLSPDTTNFLNSLERPIEHLERSIEAVQAQNENNDFVILDELTNRFSQEAGTNYIAILPEQLKDRFGKNLGSAQMKDFFRLQWSFVIDLNTKTIDGLFEQAPSEKKSTLRIITNDTSEVTGNSIITNWLFAKGRNDLVVFDDKTVLRETPRLFNRIFSKIVRTGLTSDYLVFDFCDSFPKLTNNLFGKLEDVFGTWEAAKDRCKIISFTKNENYKDSLREWSDDYGIQVYFINATFGDFINHLNEVKPINGVPSPNRLLIRGNSLDLTESEKRYNSVGIEFYGPSKAIEQERRWDFYSGAEITWSELEKQCDVTRDLYFTVKQRVTEIIRSLRRTTIYTLKHRPGSGATTLARRLAFDIKKEEENGILTCTVIDIKSCSNIRLTEQYLCQLSEKIDNTAILAIVEAKRVGRDKFDNLVKRISDAGKKVLFFYVEPFTGKFRPTKDNVVYLESNLRPNEQLRFEEKYKQLGLRPELLLDSKKGKKSLEVVDFPLMLRDNETSENLASYVQEWMETLPDNLRKYCAYVGFVFKYSDLGVNQRLLKPIWSDNNHQSSIMSHGYDVLSAIKKLLIEESTDDGTPTGIWRPRYNRFSEFLLRSYKQNWESGISEIAKELISLCKGAGELGSDDKDMIYSIFIIRKNADYRAVEDKDNLRNKFSLLIKDIDDVERAEALFSMLVEAFPNDSVLRGHYARFLYEKAVVSKGITVDDRLFQKAQENLDIAFDLDSNDSDLHHMQGMLLRRQIAVLHKMFNSEKQGKSIDEIDTKEIQDCLDDWTLKAADAFQESIDLSPASPYGYAAKSQLYKEAIEFGKNLLQCKDYSFCETDPTYSEYAEQLGVVLDLFEQICYAFKDEGLAQILDSYKIYEKVRAFHQTIVGNNEESIQRYRAGYGRAVGEKKLLYASLLVKSIVYSKTRSNKDTRRAYSNLTTKERKEIEEVLEFQKNKGDTRSYETLFMLKLYGREEYSLDDAIDLLKEWERQLEHDHQTGWGYLNACFYLAVCYSSKAIIGDVPNYELSSLAMQYFKKAEDFAKKFDKSAVLEQCYFGEREDIHCIVDKHHKSDAGTITGVIHSIKNNKNGILKMRCGLEVSFNAQQYDILRDEGQTLRGVLGFSYKGPGLYDFSIETAIDERETTFEELEESYVPIDDLVDEAQEESVGETSNPVPPKATPTVVGYIDLGQFESKKTNSPQTTKAKKDKQLVGLKGKINEERTKVFVKTPTGNRSYIIEKTKGFAPDCSPDMYDYAENEEVVFDLRETTNPKNNEPFYFAINIRPASEVF